MKNFSNFQLAVVLLSHLDYGSQLHAIREQLDHHAQMQHLLDLRIEQLEKNLRTCDSEELSFVLSSDRDELCHKSVFQSAAHSTAAVGMLAPFVESIFDQTFLTLQTWFEGPNQTLPPHPRWAMPQKRRWDCHYLSTGQKDLAKGVAELCEAVGLTSHLPTNYHRILAALIAYRNKILHCGFEWPAHERDKFATRINEEGWDDWFASATTNNRPWVFFLSDKFVSTCLNEIELILAGIGQFAFSLPGNQE